jgi:pilus assembly protein FimV
MLGRCRNIVAAIGLVAGFAYSSNLLALGLGQLTVNSSLNEPLDATIQLLGLDGLTVGQILTSMGGTEDFARANIDRVGLIDDIHMEVEIFNARSGVVHLTSTDPVVEPFLSMVISVRWPNGRLMRDYTALIDLPLFISNEPQATPVDVPETPAPTPARESEPPLQPEPRVFATEEPVITEPVAPVQEESVAVEETPPATVEEGQVAEVEEEVIEPEPAPVITTAAVEEAPEPAPVEETPVSQDVVVEAGDTLYGIAATNRPNTSVSVEQTMLAIQPQ